MGKCLHKKDKKDLLIYLKLYLSHKRNTLINLIQNFLNDYFAKKKKKSVNSKDKWTESMPFYHRQNANSPKFIKEKTNNQIGKWSEYNS